MSIENMGKPKGRETRIFTPSTNGMPTAAEVAFLKGLERVSTTARVDYQNFGNVERVFGEGLKAPRKTVTSKPMDVINEGAWIHRIV